MPYVILRHLWGYSHKLPDNVCKRTGCCYGEDNPCLRQALMYVRKREERSMRAHIQRNQSWYECCTVIRTHCTGTFLIDSQFRFYTCLSKRAPGLPLNLANKFPSLFCRKNANLLNEWKVSSLIN